MPSKTDARADRNRLALPRPALSAHYLRMASRASRLDTGHSEYADNGRPGDDCSRERIAPLSPASRVANLGVRTMDCQVTTTLWNE